MESLLIVYLEVKVLKVQAVMSNSIRKKKVRCIAGDEPNSFYFFVKESSSEELPRLFWRNKFKLRKFNIWCVRLSIEKSRVERCPSKFLQNFTHLSVLELTHCGLKQITTDDLKGLYLLHFLYLSNNRLTTVPGNLFEHTPNLEEISLRGNKLTSIGHGILDPLGNLKLADFRFNISINVVYADLSMDKYSYVESAVSLTTLKWIIENHEFTIWPHKTLQSEALKDFTIIVNNERHKVHRLMLAAHSPVLLRMFENNPEAKVLELADISPNVLNLILNFIYEKRFPNKEHVMLEVYAAAGKLEIEPLRRYAEYKLASIVNSSNAYEMLLMSNKYESEQLKTAAFEFIKNLIPEKAIKPEWRAAPEKLRTLMMAKRKRDEIVKEAMNEFESLNVSDGDENKS